MYGSVCFNRRKQNSNIVRLKITLISVHEDGIFLKWEFFFKKLN
jgi:hypothetical protein